MTPKPRNSTGAWKTFWRFSRTMTHKSALKWIRRFIAEDRPQLSPDPLCVETRQVMAAYYDKPYQGD